MSMLDIIYATWHALFVWEYGIVANLFFAGGAVIAASSVLIAGFVLIRRFIRRVQRCV